MRQFNQVKNFILGKLEKELPAHLCYHNIIHTKDVMQAVEKIAVNENITGFEIELLLTAALFHDTGFFKQREGHELVSCSIAKQYLPLYGYNQTEIELICNLIMATRIPQSPFDKLSEILCDADLDYLGRKDFFELSERLFTELRAEGLVTSEEEWNRQQVIFIAGHHYFTKTSVNLLHSKKEEHIKEIKSRISTPEFK